MRVLDGIQKTEHSQVQGKTWNYNQESQALGQVPSLHLSTFLH